jgi:hypothetical protein
MSLFYPGNTLARMSELTLPPQKRVKVNYRNITNCRCEVFPMPVIGDVFFYHPQSEVVDDIKWSKPRSAILITYEGRERVVEDHLLLPPTNGGRFYSIEYAKKYPRLIFRTASGMRILKTDTWWYHHGRCDLQPFHVAGVSFYRKMMHHELTRLFEEERCRLPAWNAELGDKVYPFTGEYVREAKEHFEQSMVLKPGHGMAMDVVVE